MFEGLYEYILFVAGGSDSMLYGASLTLTYAMGIGIPFILAAAFAGVFLRFMARFRQHMDKVEKTMGALLVITGLLFITGAMQRMSYYILEMFPQLGAYS